MRPVGLWPDILLVNHSEYAVVSWHDRMEQIHSSNTQTIPKG